MRPLFLVALLAGCATAPGQLPIPLPELDEDMPLQEKVRVIREFSANDAEVAGRRAAKAGWQRAAACLPVIAQLVREKQVAMDTAEPTAGPIDAFVKVELILHPEGPPDDRLAISCDAFFLQLGKRAVQAGVKGAQLYASFGATGDYVETAKKLIDVWRALRSGR